MTRNQCCFFLLEHGVYAEFIYLALFSRICPALLILEKFLQAWARFTKYLTIILPLSYDNAKVTMDLRWSSGLQNILQRMQGFF